MTTTAAMPSVSIPSGAIPSVAILGAGVAGASLALRLARAGRRVTLIEGRAFPRVKVCGEYLSPASARELHELLPEDALRALGAKRADMFALELDERAIEWPTPTGAWSLSRATLDTELVRLARAAGAEVLQPESAQTVELGDECVRINLASGREVLASVVVHADGSGRLDPAGPTPTVKGLVGLKCHYRPEQPVRGVRIRVSRGAYLGTIAIERGCATLALCAHSELVREFAGDHDALVRSRWPAWDLTRRTSDWKACGVPRAWPIAPAHPRSVRIGNARAAVDPVGGEGMGLALWSAARAAEALGAIDWRTTDALVQAQRKLHAEYCRRLRTRLPACRWAAELAMSPRLVRAAWPVLRATRPVTFGAWYRLMGKPA